MLVKPTWTNQQTHCFICQSDAKTKNWVRHFSHALHRLQVLLRSDWFIAVFGCLWLARCDYFGFGFTTVIRKLIIFVHLAHREKAISELRKTVAEKEDLLNRSTTKVTRLPSCTMYLWVVVSGSSRLSLSCPWLVTTVSYCLGEFIVQSQ